MQILRSILVVSRQPGVSISPALMHRFSIPSRPLPTFMASPLCHWWPPALARRDFPLTVAPNPLALRVSRFSHESRNMPISSGEKVTESPKRLLISSVNEHSAIAQGVKNIEAKAGTATAFEVVDAIARKQDAFGKILDISGCEEDRTATMGHRVNIGVSDDEKEDLTTDKKRDASFDAQTHPCYPTDDVLPMYILPESRHRDGSIYRATHTWRRYYRIAECYETRLDAMMLSNPEECVIRDGICIWHPPWPMLQIFSLKLAKLSMDGGSVELYGYVAARDGLDPLRNYIVNVSREDPLGMEEGFLINMIGPKRGIDLCDTTLIEYDMKIKIGEQEKDDLQLIDGVSEINGVTSWDCSTFTNRIHGEYGAIDFTASCLQQAVEATVEVFISEVHSSLNLCLRCFIRGLKGELRLFDGTIAGSCGLKRSVVAVKEDFSMDLMFRIGAESSGSAEHSCSFKADVHGRVIQEMKTDFGLISVKVTWSTLNL